MSPRRHADELERFRVADTDHDLKCRGCGRTISLYYNGGELDRAECCGYVYTLESVGTDLAIRKPEPRA